MPARAVATAGIPGLRDHRSMEERLRVLFIAFYYPPTGGGGVERTLEFSRRLPALGIDVEMLVPTDAKWIATDVTSLERFPADVIVHRIPYRGPSLRRLPGERIRDASSSARRLALRAGLAPQRLLIPDANAPWLIDVVPAARRLLRTGRFDALVTTAPPHTVTVAGRLIRARCAVPWIADWRDPWTMHADLNLARRSVLAKRAASRQIERWCLGATDAVSVVEPADREVISLRPDLPIEVIPNGVDLDEIDAIHRRPDPAHCTLNFSGWFFGARSPRILLEAVAAVAASDPEARNVLRLRFIGGFPDVDRAHVERLGLTDVVHIEPPVPRVAALQAQADADVGLVFMQDAPGRAEWFVPSKVWELLAIGRPVLAFVPPHGSAAREIAAIDGIVVAPDDAAGARAAVEHILAQWRAGALTAPALPAEQRWRLSRQSQAEALAALIRRTVRHQLS
jgi:glycosyltransferase involved in cell wall biosynthesis